MMDIFRWIKGSIWYNLFVDSGGDFSLYMEEIQGYMYAQLGEQGLHIQSNKWPGEVGYVLKLVTPKKLALAS